MAQVKATRTRVEAFVTARYHAGEYRDADLRRFLARVVPVVLAGRRQVSSLTDSYLARKLGTKPLGPIDTKAIRGVPVDEVYTRPFVTVRTKLAGGLPYENAVSAGAARLVDIVLSDLQLAKTHTASSVFSRADGVHGYRRTLTGAVNCALCTEASSQRYHTGDLMPIHPGCDCGVEPLFEPTGRVIESKAVAVREHGELGPLLTVPGQHFDGPSVA